MFDAIRRPRGPLADRALDRRVGAVEGIAEEGDARVAPGSSESGTCGAPSIEMTPLVIAANSPAPRLPYTSFVGTWR